MDNKVGLNLLPRKEFELVQPDGSVVQGKFGTWALNRFGQKRKMTLPQILALFMAAEELQIADLLDFVLCSIEYKERLLGKPPSFNDVKLCEWIDEYSEVSGETGILYKLFNHANDEGEEKGKPPEKKTERELNGVSSSALSIAQD